jgi:hypothetical protein
MELFVRERKSRIYTHVGPFNLELNWKFGLPWVDFGLRLSPDVPTNVDQRYLRPARFNWSRK